MEDKSTDEKLMSAQDKLQSCHDPGWNDPPKRLFSASNSSGTPTKRLLNKRVAFPLNSTSSTTNQLSSSINVPLLPPSTQSTIPTVLPPLPPKLITNNPTSGIIVDKEQGLNDTLKNLDYVINNILKDNDKIDEIQKRLGIMKSMWTDNKLNSQIYGSVYELSEALKSNDVDAADKIHVSLLMNHGAVCNAWISAIRHLILTMKEKNNHKTNEEVSDNTNPFLLPIHTVSN